MMKICKCVLSPCVLLQLLALSGCARPRIAGPDGARIEGYEQAVQQIQADPLAFLRESLAETEKLDRFTTDFCRQERLGVLQQLKPIEHIRAEYRREPLSIRFTWTDKESEFQQCVYVQGANEDKVLLLPRGLLGLPPAVQKYPPTWAVLFGKSKFPITDFGPRRMMEKTIERIEKAQAFGKVNIAVKDAALIGQHKEPCFHLELRYPKGDQFPAKLQDLYIHAQTRLPVATYLWLPGKEERSSATLDAMYQYTGLSSGAELDDSNFRIDGGRSGRKTALSSPDSGESDAATDAAPQSAVSDAAAS